MRAGTSIFLQPHYDDVALSCGATAALRARTAPAHVITIFASELVTGMVGDFAAWKHARWKLQDADEVVATRRREDEQAAARLGCSLRWLGLPDAIYRGDRYTSDDQLFGALHPDEYALAGHLAEELRNLPEWEDASDVFVPLGVGSHVDHQLVFETGCLLAAAGAHVWAYEDLPYAIHSPSAVEARLAVVRDRLGEQVIVPVRHTLADKLAAVAAYGSQLPNLFRFTADYRASLIGHAAGVGKDGPAERFWRIGPPSAAR